MSFKTRGIFILSLQRCTIYWSIISWTVYGSDTESDFQKRPKKGSKTCISDQPMKKEGINQESTCQEDFFPKVSGNWGWDDGRPEAEVQEALKSELFQTL